MRMLLSYLDLYEPNEDVWETLEEYGHERPQQRHAWRIQGAADRLSIESQTVYSAVGEGLNVSV